MSSKRFLFAWRHAIASQEGPERHTDRLVALVLSLYMNGDGLSAWPNQDTMARRSSLTDRAVGLSLERLCGQGWLSRQPRKSPRGNRHRRYGYEYRAMLPAPLAAAYVKGERRSLFKGTETAPPGRSSPSRSNGERDDSSMANGVRTNTSVEYFTKSMPLRKKDLPPQGEATLAAQEVQKRRAARDEFIAQIEAEDARELGGS